MKMRRLLFLLLVIILCFPAFVFAETVVLKSGQKVEGRILERTDKYIKIDFHGVPIKYGLEDIESIDGNPVEAAAKNETVATPQIAQKMAVARPQTPGVINWHDNLDEALSMARRDEKPLMIDFYTDWCGWCKKLDNDVYSNQTIRALSDQFICVKINADNNKSVAGHYNVRGYPTIIFLGPKGDVLNTSFGYVDANTLAGMMKSIAGESTQTERDKQLDYMKSCPVSSNQTRVGMQRRLSPAGLMVASIFSAITYVYFSLCLVLIAKKSGMGPTWLAWIPIANIFLMFNIAGISYWFMLLMVLVFFIPIIGVICYVIFAIYLWYQIAVAVNKSGWAGVLVVVPIIGYVAIGYLAFSKAINMEGI